MAEWAYRLKNGEIEAEIFDEPPQGWHDSPAKCVEKPKRGRPASKVVGDGDSK